MRFLIFALITFSLTACQSNAQNEEGSEEESKQPPSGFFSDVDPENAPKIEFTELTYRFGEIYHAERTSHDYVFTNKGKSDLIIESVRASCGCTQPTYPQEPIAPGESGAISVLYNSVGKQGSQRATIRVRSNDPTQPEVVLKLFGKVLVKPRD